MLSPPHHFENEAGVLALETGRFLRIACHNTYHDQAAFQILMNKALDIMRVGHCGRLLVDHRKGVPYSTKECAWLLTDWLPRAVEQANFRFAAFISSYDVFVRLATASFTQQMREAFGIQYHYFEGYEEEEATEWLLNKPSTC